MFQIFLCIGAIFDHEKIPKIANVDMSPEICKNSKAVKILSENSTVFVAEGFP